MVEDFVSEMSLKPATTKLQGISSLEDSSLSPYPIESESTVCFLSKTHTVRSFTNILLSGFFTTGTKENEGNIGLWDQTTALQFVKKNIKNFGGNPDNITVWGQSAGAASVDLLSLSPHSRGKLTLNYRMHSQSCRIMDIYDLIKFQICSTRAIFQVDQHSIVG